MKRNKIFLLYPYYWPHYKAGGPVQSLFNLVSHFHHEAEFYLISYDRDIDGKHADKPLELNKWSAGPHGEFIYYTHSISVVLLYRLMNAVKPDIIFINGLFYLDTSLLGLLAGRLTNRRICISPRGMLQGWALARKAKRKKAYLFFIRRLIGKKIEWHATDNQERDDIHTYFGDGQKVNVALNIPRRISEFRSIDFPGTNDGRIKLVFLSLVNPNKNLHLVIDEVNEAPHSFSLDIYGPVMDETYWKKCQQKIRDGSPVAYHGPVSAWEVPSILQQYHFFVLPTQGENFGHAIFDALSSGVPVIIPRTTPWQDLDQNNAGIYFGLDSEPSLRSVLGSISGFTSERYTAMRESSLAYAKQYVSIRDFNDEYKFLIQSNGKSSA